MYRKREITLKNQNRNHKRKEGREEAATGRSLYGTIMLTKEEIKKAARSAMSEMI